MFGQVTGAIYQLERLVVSLTARMHLQLIASFTSLPLFRLASSYSPPLSSYLRALLSIITAFC